jgi:hypothetical protein
MTTFANLAPHLGFAEPTSAAEPLSMAQRATLPRKDCTAGSHDDMRRVSATALRGCVGFCGCARFRGCVRFCSATRRRSPATTQGKHNNITGANSPANHQSMEMVTGKKDATLDPGSTSEEDIATKLALELSEKKGVTLWTVTKDQANAKDADAHKPRIITNHGYTLDNVNKDKKTVDLLNPWGAEYAIAGLAISDVKKFFRQIRIGG